MDGMSIRALEYLKYLHSLEHNYRYDITTFDVALVVEQIRLEFVSAYRTR